MKRLLACALLALSSIAFGATLNPIQLLNPAGSTAGQAIVSTGPTTAPAWASMVNSIIAGSGVTVSGATGNVTISVASNAIALSQIAQQAANTVLANPTGSTGNVQAFSMPSCSTSTSALQWTSGTGFTCLSTSASTTATLAQFAATTSAQLAGVISDETGSGALVFAASPTITTPTINGVTNASSAAAGSIGQIATNTTSGTSLTNGTPANCTSASLSAGDWDVSGAVQYIPSSATMTLAASGISTTSATLGSVGSITFLQGISSPGAVHVASPVFQVNVSSTTTVFLVGQANFASGTVTCNGFIRARRMH